MTCDNIKSHKKQGFTLSLEDTFLENHRGATGRNPPAFLGLNKNKTESKMENPTHTFREVTLCFRTYKNRELKVQLS